MYLRHFDKVTNGIIKWLKTEGDRRTVGFQAEVSIFKVDKANIICSDGYFVKEVPPNLRV